MPKLSSQNSNMLIKFVKNNRNKKIIINLLSDILNLNINDFYGATIEKFEDISEYKFSLIKLHVILSNKDNLDLEIVIGEEETLKNVYSVVRIKDIDDETKAITDKLVEFYSSDEMKDTIREYGKDKYGEPLYFVIGE